MRLVEYFFELFYYTLFLKSLDFSQFPYDTVAKRYKTILANSLNAAKRDGVTERDWGQGLFPVCAWIDETVFCSDWDERFKWGQNPLQYVFFKTMNGGEEFFTRLAGLEPDAKQVREIYAFCLTLGFKGKYFQEQDAEVLSEIVRANLDLVSGKSGLEYPGTYFPESYAWSGERPGRGTPLRGVTPAAAIGFALPVLLFAALLLWFGNDLAGAAAMLFPGGPGH